MKINNIELCHFHVHYRSKRILLAASVNYNIISEGHLNSIWQSVVYDFFMKNMPAFI